MHLSRALAELTSTYTAAAGRLDSGHIGCKHDVREAVLTQRQVEEDDRSRMGEFMGVLVA